MGLPCGHRSPIPTVGLSDGLVERVVLHVIELRAVVQAPADGSVFPRRELVEELAHLVSVRRARELGVLPQDAHTRLQHHGHQKPRLALRVAEFRDRLYPILKVHAAAPLRVLRDGCRRPRARSIRRSN